MKLKLTVAGALLLLQFAWLSQEMGWLHVWNWKPRAEGVFIGKIFEASNNPRIKSAKNVYWHAVQTDDRVQYYDTLLTLDQSYIKIQLQDETEFTVEPNSLIVLEPSEDSLDQLNLVIKRGGIQASQKKNKTKIIEKKKENPQQPIFYEKIEDVIPLVEDNPQQDKQQVTETDEIAEFEASVEEKDPFVWFNPKNKSDYYTEEKYADIPVSWSQEPSQIVLENVKTNSRSKATKDQISKLSEGEYRITVVSPELTTETRWIRVIQKKPIQFVLPLEPVRNLSALDNEEEVASTSKLAVTEPETVPMSVPENKNQILISDRPIDWTKKYKSWAWLGSGYQNTTLNQKISGTTTPFGFNASGFSNVSLAAGHYFSDSFGSQVSYSQYKGKVQSSNTLTVANGGFEASVLSLEALYKIPNLSNLKNKLHSFVLTLGLAREEKPTFFLNTSNSNVSLKDISVTQAEFGFQYGYQWSERTTFELLSSYSHPFSESASSGDAVSVSPKHHFNATLGMSYQLVPQLFMGLHWLGTWQSYDQTYSSGAIQNQSAQEVQDSNVQVRIGTDF